MKWKKIWKEYDEEVKYYVEEFKSPTEKEKRKLIEGFVEEELVKYIRG